MKRALLLALLLAGGLAVWILRPDHAGGAQPEPSTNLPQATLEPDPIESSETVIESANAVGSPARESLATETNASANDAGSVALASVRVEVRYRETGLPAKAAVVELRESQGEARTNEHGVAEFRLPKGSHVASIRIDPTADGSPFVPYERYLDVILAPGRTDLSVRVDRGADLRGFVRDVVTDRPIAGASLRYLGLGPRPGIKTQEDGSFELRGLLGGPWNYPGELEVEHPHYLREVRRLERTDVVPDARPIVVTMRRGILLTGRIVDSEHLPVPNAQVSLISDGERVATSDEHGRFEFGGLTASEQASVSVPMQPLSTGAVLAGRRELGPLQADMLDVELQVPAGVVLEVYADGPDGRALLDYQYEVRGFEEFYEGVQTPEPRAFRTGIVPSGLDVQLEVFATILFEDDPEALRSMTTNIHTEPGAGRRITLHVPLTEKRHLEIPPLPAGVQELRIRSTYGLVGALDVQLLELADGIPVTNGKTLHVSSPGWSSSVEVGLGGWLRLREFPGSHEIRARLDGGPSQAFVATIPPSGYAKTEWRLSSKP